MRLRRLDDLALLFRDGRARKGWSQSDLARHVGVSRQWVSLVENGKTSVDFSLVGAALRALGYDIHVSTRPPGQAGESVREYDGRTLHAPTGRGSLTRSGRPLGVTTSARPGRVGEHA